MDTRSREHVASELRATATASGWTFWQLAQAIHDQAKTPTLLKAWRLAYGQTQTQVITGIQGLTQDDGCPCAPSPSTAQISRWENGHERVGPFYRPYFALWFRAPLHRLGLAEADPVVNLAEKASPQEDDVERRKFLSLPAAAVVPVLGLEDIRARLDSGLRRVLPTPDLQHWNDIVQDHVTSIGTASPEKLLQRIAPDLATIADLTDRYPHQRDLHLVASRLCGIVGGLHTDLENDQQTRDWLHTADKFAALAGDSTQRAWVWMAQAMFAYYKPAPHKAITVYERARQALPGHHSAPMVQLAGLAARAHADLGHADKASRILQQTEESSTHVPAAQADEVFWGFPPRQLTMYRCHVLSRADDPTAWNVQAQALEEYPDDDPIDRPLILLERARYLAPRDPDEASHIAGTAFAQLQPAQQIPLLRTRVRDVAACIRRTSPTAATQLLEQTT